MDNVQEILAKNLRLARNAANISQEELAEKAELDRTYVSGIERGLRNPTILVLSRFAFALNTTASKLLVKDAFSGKKKNNQV